MSLSSLIIAQSVGDTIIVPSFNYSQTSGSGIRDTMIDFPDDPTQTYEKIIMLYNMRCKDGLVSVPGNTNLGCGEWDYSCNTYITDSSKVDSVISFIDSHVISNFSGSNFDYVEDPMYDYYQSMQHNVTITNINSETQSTIGAGSIVLDHVIGTEHNSGKSQYLYTASELNAAGVVAGGIDGLLLNSPTGGTTDFFRIRLKQTTESTLTNSMPETTGFTEVFYNNTTLTSGENRLQFYTPFSWDGTTNLIVEFSFTNDNPGTVTGITGEETGNDYGLYSGSDYHMIFNAFNYIETNDYKGIEGSADRTCEAWIKTGVNNKEIISWGRNAASQKWVFRINDDGTIRVEVNGGNVWGTTPVDDNDWHHVACVFSGTDVLDVLLYVDGQLETQGGGTAEPVNTNIIDGINLRVSKGVNNRYFDGIIDEVRVWDAALSQQQIQDYMYRSIDASHPAYSSLMLYFPLDEGTGTDIFDQSQNSRNGSIINGSIWGEKLGVDIFRNFIISTERPNTTFLQGDYTLNIVDNTVATDIQIVPRTVIEYEIIPNYGTMKNDSLNEVMNTLMWEEGYEVTYNTSGSPIDSTLIPADGTIQITELTYFMRYPSKYEIMSFVTPYGIYLDLGMDGKTWAFDVTDYTPILKGSKRMTIERGGQRQEDMDIKFLYIPGTPPHDVLDINQVWRPDYKSYTSIQADRSFEPRDFTFDTNGDMFKFRSVITGHGQEGEFNGRYHTLNIDGGDIEYEWRVWDECAENPIYPQGGTWIYDRAGWCPGAPSTLIEYDITNNVGAGQTHNLDYGLVYASGTSNYIVNNQLVTYGAPNFSLDAAITGILKPNSYEASAIRFNPACSYPEVVVQNTGSTQITSIELEYFIDGGVSETHTWYGTLDFLQKNTIILPIDDITFWDNGTNVFNVNLVTVNDQEDDYSYNNSYSVPFEDLYVFPDGNNYTIQLKTNNYGFQSSYTLKDGDGTLLFERDGCDNNTLYEDEFNLSPGCYELRIDDTGDNGLDFWALPQQGTGYFKIVNTDGITLYTFEPDFGGYASFEFGIGQITNIENTKRTFSSNVYPNPVSDKLLIELNGQGESEVKVRLANSLSAVVFEKHWFTSTKATETSIDMTNFTSGVYILTIQYGNSTHTKKVVKH